MFWHSKNNQALRLEIASLKAELEALRVSLEQRSNEVSEKDRQILLLTTKYESTLDDLARARSGAQSFESLIVNLREENASLYESLAKTQFELNQATTNRKLALDALNAQEARTKDVLLQLAVVETQLHERNSEYAELLSAFDKSGELSSSLESELTGSRELERRLYQQLSLAEEEIASQRRALNACRNSAANNVFRVRDLESTVTVLSREIERRRSWIHDLARQRDHYAKTLLTGSKNIDAIKEDICRTLGDIIANMDTLSSGWLQSYDIDTVEDISRAPQETSSVDTQPIVKSSHKGRTTPPISGQIRRMYELITACADTRRSSLRWRRDRFAGVVERETCCVCEFAAMVEASRGSTRRISLSDLHNQLSSSGLSLRRGQLRRILTVTHHQWR